LSGLSVSASTVERVTEAAGERVAELRAVEQPIGPTETWAWPVDAAGKTTAFSRYLAAPGFWTNFALR
jgi:hypothetical protein